MIDHEPQSSFNEGNLARTWEKKLRYKEKVNSGHKRRPWVRTILWIGSLWGAAMAASILAIHVMVMGYQVDQLQSRYTHLQREQQLLSANVASLSSPVALNRQASKMNLTMVTPRPNAGIPSPASASRPAVSADSTHATWIKLVDQWINQLRGAVVKS